VAQKKIMKLQYIGKSDMPERKYIVRVVQPGKAFEIEYNAGMELLKSQPKLWQRLDKPAKPKKEKAKEKKDGK